MLTVVDIDPEAPRGAGIHARWLCRCDCGKYVSLSSAQLTGKRANKSCGCYLHTKHLTHGKTGSRLYNVWNSMKQRCTNSNVKTFDHYGGKGITVCEEWMNSFEAFEEWALSHGYDPEERRGKCTIDRIDNSKGYSPENCRIVDMKVQGNNRTYNKRR